MRSITTTLAGAAGVTAAVVLVCAVTAQEPPQDTAATFDYAAYVPDGQHISLELQSMTSLPGDRLFLGGTYHNGAGPVHSALLTSTTAGATWTESSIRVEGTGVRRLAAFGSRHVWALLTSQTEGTDGPVAIVRSDDAGRTWQRFAVELPPPALPEVPAVDELRFYDSRHGLLRLRNASEDAVVFETRDGGESWRRLWGTTALYEAIEPFVYPQPDLPLHATLWIQQADYYKAVGLVRVLSETWPAEHVVERGPAWQAVGTIARRYRIAGTGLVAAGPESR